MLDPLKYFDEVELRESLVIKLVCSSKQRLAEIVISYAAEAVLSWFEAQLRDQVLADLEPPPRDFRQFTFHHMSNLRRNGSNVQSVQVGFGPDSPPIVISSRSLTRVGDGYEFVIELNNGDYVSFSFESLEVS